MSSLNQEESLFILLFDIQGIYMMNPIDDFSSLPKNEQVYILFHEGRKLFERTSKQYSIHLFRVADSWVEVWYSSNQSLIENIQVLNKRELLETYGNILELTKR